MSFGRYVNSTGEAQYPAQIANSLGATNAGPRVGPVVINEINYHPAPGGDEFIELLNISNAPVPLYDPAFPTKYVETEWNRLRFSDERHVGCECTDAARR